MKGQYRVKRKTTPETSVKRSIKKFLKQSKPRIWHYSNLAGIGSAPGLSDITGICPDGRYLAIEVKAPGKRVKPGSDQERFLQNVIDNGGVAIEADGVPALVRGLAQFGIRFNILPFNH